MATNKRRGASTRPSEDGLPASLWLDEPGDGRFGTREVQGWMHDKGQYAIQVRGHTFNVLLRERHKAKLWADALVGDYLRIWLVRVANESEGRKLVLDLLALANAESDRQLTPPNLQSNPKVSGHLDREADSGISAGHLTTPETPPSAEWFDDRGCFGVAIGCAFQRRPGHYVFQLADPRLWKAIGRRKDARVVGASAGCFGPLRQYELPVASKAKAVKVLKSALATLAEGKQ